MEHLPKIISSPRAEEANRMSTGELREHFLVSGLMRPGALSLVYTDLDRLIAGGAVPEAPLRLPPYRELGTRYFTERRELGIVNVGDAGAVSVGGKRYTLDRLDCLYVGIEEPEVAFERNGAGQPQFYFLSCPAVKKYPAAKITPAEANLIDLGDEQHASKRRVCQYICPGRVASCQLTLGFTELAPNSVWSTMPAHLHSRRVEIYFYFDMPDGIVVHLLGKPGATRHLIVREKDAVLSPAWSIHSGAGTRSYRFVWGMAGENQAFTDTDPVPMSELR